MSQTTMDEAITTDILTRNLELVLHALADAQMWREEAGDDGAAELYAALAAELEEFSE